MKLKTLQLAGFKSFIDKTAIRFPAGISAIVGPNGCGKSNIVDAMRWVMGEQSVKQLRGKAREDVIFAGADGKPPLNLAEVSLTLLNDNGSAPEEFRDLTEIMVTRRLYRSGESAYFLNKRPCRLKDIHNLFMGSGMGARAYAVIEQGNIGAITEAGPDQRRVFIEEAAGVTRYKSRKIEALRKVAATNQNLYRLEDILSEVERQMRGLKRQARKAERYRKHQHRMRDLDVVLALYYYDDYSRRIAESDALLTALKDKDIAHTSKIKQLDAAVEQVKIQRWQKNQLIGEQKNTRHEKQRAADKAESALAHTRDDLKRFTEEVARQETAAKDLEINNRNMDREIEQVRAEADQLQSELDTARRRLADHRKSSEGIRQRLTDCQQQHERFKSKLMDLVAEEARLKNIRQNSGKNKESVQRRLKRIAEDLEVARKALSQSDRQSVRLKAEVLENKQWLEELNVQISHLKNLLAEQQDVLRGQVKAVQTLAYDRTKTKSRYTTLKKMEGSFEWYKEGVRAIMLAARQPTESKAESDGPGISPPPPPGPFNHETVIGLTADLITPAPGYETAVEAALGEALQYVFVQDTRTGEKAIEYLQQQGQGRSGFIPVDAVKSAAPPQTCPPKPARRLLNHLTVNSGFEGVVENLLGHVVVCDSLPEATALWSRNGVWQTIVTKGGDMISPQGIMVGGSRDKLSDILTKKQEVTRLQNKLADFEQKLAGAHTRQKDLEDAARALDDDLQRAVQERHQASQTVLEAEKSLYKATEDQKNARRHLDILSLEQEQLLGEELDLDEEVSRYNQSVAATEKAVKTAQDEVARTSVETETIARELEAFNQEMVEDQLQQTSLSARLENCDRTQKRLTQYRRDAVKQLEQITREIGIKKNLAIASETKIKTLESDLILLYEEIEHLDRTLAENENEYSAIDTKLKQNDVLISDIQTQREQSLEKTRVLELDQSRRQIKRETVARRLEEYYHQSPDQFRSEYVEQLETLNASADQLLDPMQAELEKLRKKIAGYTDVNLGAIKEYDELKERHDFLSRQRDDLKQAIEDLHKVIHKINRITQTKFIETFERVNEKLKEVFPRLFEGGSAILELTQPDKPLETGVEYLIHPPGKKLTRMSLLSGGEKALSAIAFIFSIFLIKPTSFCLMDEIDAPLDEANTFRFNDLLQMIGQKSQIIMVTHNKSSMEFADTLFGITMEKKGISKVVSVNLQQTAALN